MLFFTCLRERLVASHRWQLRSNASLLSDMLTATHTEVRQLALDQGRELGPEGNGPLSPATCAVLRRLWIKASRQRTAFFLLGSLGLKWCISSLYCSH
jgi:hypothetical protein